MLLRTPSVRGMTRSMKRLWRTGSGSSRYTLIGGSRYQAIRFWPFLGLRNAMEKFSAINTAQEYGGLLLPELSTGKLVARDCTVARRHGKAPRGPGRQLMEPWNFQAYIQRPLSRTSRAL